MNGTITRAMRLALLGSPGHERGDIAASLAARAGLIHLDPAQAPTTIDLESDIAVLDWLAGELVEFTAHSGFVLSGFPRNPLQARQLDHTLALLGRPLDSVVGLVDDDTGQPRYIAGASYCPGCEIHVQEHAAQPAGRPSVCPRCGSRLPSERPQALRRQQALGQQYLAVLRYYRSQNRLVVVDRLDPDALQADLQRRLDRPAGL